MARAPATAVEEKSEDKEKPKPATWIGFWQSVLIAVITSILAFAGGWWTFANQSRELDIKMIDISLAILAGERGGVDAEVNDEKTYAEYRLARTFALKVLSKYSGVPLSEVEITEWAQSGKISFGDVPAELRGWANMPYFSSITPYGISGSSGLLNGSAGTVFTEEQWAEKLSAAAATGSKSDSEECRKTIAGQEKLPPTFSGLVLIMAACGSSLQVPSEPTRQLHLP